jgi:hypothetical protein
LLTPEHCKESLARAYIHAIAGQVGLSCSIRDYDYGIDITLHEITIRTDQRSGKKRYIESGMPLDIQIKSTATAIVDEYEIKYDLNIDAYNDLRDDSKYSTPRILVLHVQPEQLDLLLHQTEHSLDLLGCCYWLSLKGRDSVKNKSSVRICIPRKNIFTLDQIRQIMNRINTGEAL